MTKSNEGALLGRVALVTGVSRPAGIGFALTRRLVADGAAVLVHSWSKYDYGVQNDRDVLALVEELTYQGAQIAHLSGDLADADVPAHLVDRARAEFGRLDILVANHARSRPMALEDLTLEEIDRTYAVNTRATLLLIKSFAAGRGHAPGGRVLLFTSGQYHGPMPNELPYVASKAALHELTGSLAAYLMPRGITVNCVNPGPNNTGHYSEQTWAVVSERNPGGRPSMPVDTARLVSWLASDDAAWITGQTIASDGGWSGLGA